MSREDRPWLGDASNGYKMRPDKIPPAVTDAIKKFVHGRDLDADKIIASLRWSYDHFSFDWCGMYVGVELDGYIHT